MPMIVVSQHTKDIQGRFFFALNTAIRWGRIKDLTTFCERHGLNRTKYSHLRSGGNLYKVIDIEALHAICMDFDVSPSWLLLGKGKMLNSADEDTIPT